MDQLEIRRIIDQIERLHSHNWTGVNINKILGEINDDIANAEQPFFNNTIHQIVRHVLATELVVIKRLQGINYKLTKEEDWVPAEKLKSIRWLDTRNSVVQSKKDLINELHKIGDADLDNPVIKDYSTIYVTVHGHIQHAYYHFGQISLMKKIIENRYLE